METNEPKDLNVKEMIISFVLLGVIAIFAILIWKRLDTLNFILDLFDPSNIIISGLVGISCGVSIAFLVAFVARLTKTKMPRNEYTDLLIRFMKKPNGPLIIGVLPGIFEELLFRGFLLAWFLSFWDPIIAIGVSTVIFWLAHVPQYKTNIVLNGVVIVLSIIISIQFVNFSTLWAPIATHIFYNYIVSLLVKKKIIAL